MRDNFLISYLALDSATPEVRTCMRALAWRVQVGSHTYTALWQTLRTFLPRVLVDILKTLGALACCLCMFGALQLAS
jgi:hypothetical protein